MFLSVEEVKNQQAVWLFNQALSQARRGNLREAISLWRKAIRLEPEWVEPRGHLALAYFKCLGISKFNNPP
ncbi:MAG: tetratricopeptide repeat protein [bacterium]|nr:tetratricopeptide repeat protein [bacterium]